MPQPIVYTGAGQSGVWNDPNNWAHGTVPGGTDFALVTQNMTLNGSIDVGQVMFLGNETITINGALTTESTNTCDGVMVCAHAVATFEAGSSLTDAGGFITGNASVGTTYVDGAGNGKAAAVLNTTALKVGQTSTGVGVLNVAGVINNSGGAYIGIAGNGTMNVTGSGEVNLRLGLCVGDVTGSVGAVTLSGNAEINARNFTIGNSVAGGPGGMGTVTVGGHSTLNSAGSIAVAYGSSLIMAGGTAVESPPNGLQIAVGGTVSGFGTLSGDAPITDNGKLASAGGTLVVSANLWGMGAVQVGANSTLDLNASRITVPAISFMGPNATLDLNTGVTGTFDIAGFGAGDQLVMNGIDALSWNSTSDVLTLSEHGQTMDKLTFSGVPANEVFHLNTASSASVITLIPMPQNH